jgi:hypothetical protein
MSPETKSSSSLVEMVLQAAREAAQHRGEQAIVTSSPQTHFETLQERVTKAQVQAQKEESEEFFRKIRVDENRRSGHISVQVSKEWAQRQAESWKEIAQDGIEDAKRSLDNAIQSSKDVRKLCEKLGIHKAADIENSPEAAHFLVMMGSLTPELQRDPHVWYEAMASLSSRLNLGVQDRSITEAAHLEGSKILKKAVDHLDKIKSNDRSGSGIADLSKDDLTTAFTEQGMGMATGQRQNRQVNAPRSESELAGDRFEKIENEKTSADTIREIRRDSGRGTADSIDTTRGNAKTAFNSMVSRDEINWLVNSDADIDAMTSPDAADFVRQLASIHNLNNDPRRLTLETLKLVYRTAGQSAATRAQIAEVVTKARDRVEALLRTRPVAGFSIQRFDAVLYGQQLEPGQKRPIGPMFPPDITDPQLLKLLGLVQYKIDTDPEYISNTVQLLKDLNTIQSDSASLEVPSTQTKQAVEQMQQLIKNAEKVHLEKNKEQQGRGGIIFWDRLKHFFTAEEWEKVKDRPPIQMQNFTPDEIELILKGQEGQEEWFSNFMAGVYGYGRDRANPSYPDQITWDSFQGFIKQVYGAKGDVYIQPYQLMWNDRGRQEYIFKTLTFEPSDIKDKLQAVRRMLGADIDNYAKTPLANIVLSQYDNALNDLMAEKQKKYFKSLRFLKDNNYQNDKLYMKLRDRYQLPVGHPNALTPAEVRQMEDIRMHIDIVAAGTMIKDTDVLMYNEVYNQWASLSQARSEIEKIPEAQRTAEQRLAMARLPEEIKKKWEQYTGIKEEYLSANYNGVPPELRYIGLSPLETEVFERTVSYLKSNGIKTIDVNGRQISLYDEKGELKVFRLRDAIFAARMIEVGSGHMAAIGSFEVTRPIDMKYFESHDFLHDHRNGIESLKYSAGKSIMWAPFMEDVVRIYNPELFAHRFGMGGDAGIQAMSILREYNMFDKGFKITKTNAWKEWAKHAHQDPGQEQLRSVMEYAESALGISFTEMLGPEFFAGGGFFDATSWRIEAAIFDEIKSKILKSGGVPAMWENQAMAIQYLIAAGEGEKRNILLRMVKRSPSKFIQILAGKEMNELLARHNLLENPEWTFCQRALSNAEISLWRDQTLLRRTDIDLTSEAGFNEILKPYLEKARADGTTVNPNTISNFKAFLKDVNILMTQDKRKGNTLVENWSKINFPMTISMSDFDWSDANFFQLGSSAMDRRGKDMIAMSQARDKMFELLTQPALLFPNDIKETVKAIYELRVGLVNAYASTEIAENVAKQVARVIIEMNRSRIINPWLDGIKGLAGVIPGANKIMRIIRDSDYRGLSKNRLLQILTLGRSKHWDHYPHSIGGALSMAVGYKGGEANAWDEFKIAGFIAALEDEGVFVNDHNIALDLRSEYKATPTWRVLATARKYWWVVPTATVVVAATQFVDEEKKEAGGGGGHH